MWREHPALQYMIDMDLYLGKPEFGPSTIRVPVRKLLILRGFPGHDRDKFYDSCTLVFDHVVTSERIVGKYGPNGINIVEKSVLTDGPFSHTSSDVYEFSFGGVSEDLNAFVSWTITASDVQIEDEIEGFSD